MQSTPLDTVRTFVEAVGRGDLQTALLHYEEDAVFFAQPNKALRGRAQIREALAMFISHGATVHTVREAAHECDGVALYQSHWYMEMKAPDGTTSRVAGISADVLRQTPDGSWRIAVDNPWGEQTLPAGEL